MRKFILSAATAVAAVAVAGSAQAAIANINYSSNAAVPAYITANQSFNENFNSYAATGLPFVPVQKDGGTQTAFRTRIFDSSLTDVAADPNGVGGGNPYLSVLGGGFYKVSFTTAQQVVSFAFGSLDFYNSVTLSFVGQPDQTLFGQAIIGGAAGNAGRVTYDQGGLAGITSITFKSALNSFEIDTIVTAAPEPATWGMMILGFGLAGAQLRSRRRSAKLAVA